MNYKLKTAFTLIELLVVIAIIGILSGLIIVGMSSSTQSANIAKAQIFSSSLRNSLMANLISEWKLDEVAVNQTPDSWSANSGTLTGSGGSQNLPQLQTTNCVHGNCFRFDGADDYINFSNPSNLNITSTVTIEAWVKPLSLPSDSGAYFGIIGKPSGLGVSLVVDSYAGANKGYSLLADAGSVRANGEAYTGLNIWKHLAGTYDGTNMKIYVNGVLKGTQAFSISQTSNNFYIGRVTGFGYFNGYVDNVRVYASAIPTSQIREQYYAGLNRLLLNRGISYNEYITSIKDNI